MVCDSRTAATVKVDKKVVRPVMAYGLETMTFKANRSSGFCDLALNKTEFN